MKSYSRTVFYAIGLAAAILACRFVSASAQTSRISTSGPITIDAKESEASPGALIYRFAHLTMKDGTTLDTDELKASESGGNQIDEATATGHVRAFVNDALNNRTYTVTADNAVYTPQKNEIDLTGNVKTIVNSSYTDGPLVQTGTSATILLGQGPDFPKIDMQQVHTELTVKQ